MVITDYTRAKSLFGDTEVAVFKKGKLRVHFSLLWILRIKTPTQLYRCFSRVAVYKEVENRVEAFRDMLYKKLLHLPLPLDEQKKLIRSGLDFSSSICNTKQTSRAQYVRLTKISG